MNHQDLITDKVYVGDINSAKKPPKDVDKIVCCAEECNNFTGRRPEDYLYIPLLDSGSAADCALFYKNIPVVVNFVVNAVDNDETVLIHCYAGLSRSCSMCLAYILSENDKMTIDDGVKYIVKRRPSAFFGSSVQVYRKPLVKYFG
jgi:protein-tyrosine phosphatase